MGLGIMCDLCDDWARGDIMPEVKVFSKLDELLSDFQRVIFAYYSDKTDVDPVLDARRRLQEYISKEENNRRHFEARLENGLKHLIFTPHQGTKEDILEAFGFGRDGLGK